MDLTVIQIVGIINIGIIVILSILLYLTTRRLSHLRHKLTASNKLSDQLNKELTTTAEISALKYKFQTEDMKDRLTGLYNREFFQSQLPFILEEEEQYHFHTAILLINLDGFKLINETFGLNAGDDVLKEAALRMQACIRDVDRLCRLSGDEYVAIITQLNKADAAAYVSQRILKALAEPFNLSGQPIFLSACIGIAVYPNDGDDVDTLFKKAVQALREVKLKGPNHFQFYRKEEISDVRQQEFILNADLRKPTIFDEFLIYYQPEVNIETKQIFCMEAILHWHHPDLGLLSQDKFLSLAEKIGNSHDINDWLVRTVCQQFNQWRAMGFDPKNIAIKISSRELENPHFTYRINKILQETTVAPSALILEISEVLLFKKMSLIAKSLHLFRQLGVRIGISDFGAGKIALDDLRHLPIDYLKVAGSLIKDIPTNREAEAIMTMVMTLGNSLGLRVIAEGVETQQQKQSLANIGCILMQGQFFCPPVLPHDFTENLEKEIIGQT